jgi:peptidoglycan-associated lipoprotein
MMTTNVARVFAAMLLAGLFLAGCESSSTRPTDDMPPETVTDTEPDTPEVPDVEAEPEDPWEVDASGNPLNRYGEPISRLFYFDFDRSIVKARAQRLLTEHAEYLVAHPRRAVRLEGHADERGTRDYNLALGERRSNAVRSYLMAQGVRSSQIRTVSYGEERPVDPGHNEAAWARNRRVELVYD